MRNGLATTVLAWTLPVLASRDPVSIQTWPLAEGATAVLVEDHRAPRVTIHLQFPAGRWSPWVRQAHAEEAFRIQLFDPGGEIRARADRLGAELTAAVGDRSSTLVATCLKENLPEVLTMVRDVLTNRSFDHRELKRWRHADAFLWAASQKDPTWRTRQAAARVLFRVHDPRRLRWEKPAAISADTIRLAQSRDTLIRLPGRILAIAGDVTREEVDRSAPALLPPVLKEVPADLTPEFAPVTPTATRERERTLTIPRLTQIYFAYYRDSLPYTDPDYPAYLVANHVLGGHFYSRLFVALRHEGGETYGAGAVSLGDVVAGPYALGTYTRTGNAAVAERKLREVLRVFHEDGITEEERAAAIGYLRGRRPFSRQSPDQMLSRFLTENRLGVAPGFLDLQVDAAAELSLEEINRFIAGWYDPSIFAMVRAR